MKASLKGAMTRLSSSFCWWRQLCVLFFRYETWEITCEWQNLSSESNMQICLHNIKRYKQQKWTLKNC